MIDQIHVKTSRKRKRAGPKAVPKVEPNQCICLDPHFNEAEWYQRLNAYYEAWIQKEDHPSFHFIEDEDEPFELDDVTTVIDPSFRREALALFMNLFNKPDFAAFLTASEMDLER